MTTVIAGVDASPAAQPVLAFARAFAPLLGAHVEAVYVATTGDSTAVETGIGPGTPLRNLQGDVVEELAALTNTDDVVAAVVGSRAQATGTHPAGARPAGHVALELADRAATPVVVVPPDAAIPDRIRRVLVAMKGTPSSARYLSRAVALVEDAGLDLVVIHVDDEASIPSFSDQVQYETDEFVREFLARNVPGAPRAQLELRIGAPADEIMRAAEAMHPDVIALGWRQHRGPEEGVVAREVVARSRVPVLLATVT